jgi:hypothetical protein
MNTQDLFKALPMAAYSSVSKPSTGYNNIQNVSLESMQQRVIPRQVTTGLTRGEQQIRGTIAVVDSTGTKRLLMGYKRGAF